MHLPQPSDNQFELPPAGTHLAACYRIIDLGTQESSYNGQAKRQHKILISWELPDERMTDGRPFTISQRYTWSAHEKSALRRDLESWRGVPFTDADFGPGGFDIKNILGKSCLLNIVHSPGDKTYANIASISRLMKGMTPKPPVNETVYMWLDQAHWSAEVFHKLGQGLQGTIMKSPEYIALMNSSDTPDNAAEADDRTLPYRKPLEAFDDPIPF